MGIPTLPWPLTALTTAIVAPIVAFAGHGARLQLFRPNSDHLTGRLATTAANSAILLTTLLTYVQQYCDCAAA